MKKWEDKNGEGLQKWVDRKDLVFPPCVWLREWRSREIENSFVWLSRKVGKYKM